MFLIRILSYSKLNPTAMLHLIICLGVGLVICVTGTFFLLGYSTVKEIDEERVMKFVEHFSQQKQFISIDFRTLSLVRLVVLLAPPTTWLSHSFPLAL